MPGAVPARPTLLRTFPALVVLALAPAGGLAAEAGEPVKPLVLDRMTVLGSRIPGTGAGMAPVGVYDRDFIAATGALRLADFLNLLPQNYTGGGSGRGSAPNDANPEFGVRTETSLPLFSVALGAANVNPGQTGVSGANLRGLGSASTLVLVDGRRRPIAGQGNRSTNTRQGFTDLNTIPLGMIERIEVLANGASTLYGSDAIGGVINIVLRKQHPGGELVLNHRGAFAGGGHERRATLSAGFASANSRLRGLLAIELYDRAELTAARRDFSARQDHREIVIGHDAAGAPVYGEDFRLNWGYPALVQARTGLLNGVTTPGGTPTRFALVPAGTTTTPIAADFTGVAATSATGLQRSNTAEFLTLLSPQQSRSLRASFEYEFPGGLLLYAGVSQGDMRSRFNTQPPVSAPVATTGFGNFATLVPALIDGRPNPANPFGQDVLVGLVHREFGPAHQKTHTRNRSAFAGLTGTVAGRWTWDAGLSWSRDRFAQRKVTLSGARFANALAAADPAQRFNPFVDANVAGPLHAALYETMTAVDTFDGDSELAVATLIMDGPLFDLPGGEVRFAAGGEYEEARHAGATVPATGVTTAIRSRRHSQAAFLEASVPLVGRDNALPLMQRLDLQLASRHQRNGHAGRSSDPAVNLRWTPAQALAFRVGAARGFRAPTLTEYETLPRTLTATVTDLRRSPASTPNVSVTSGSNAAARPETSEHTSFGAVLTPSFAPGLSFSVDFHRTRQHNVLQELSAASLLANEAVLASRITRTAPTPQDLALGQPGAITAIDATFVNLGSVKNETVDLALSYDFTAKSLGRFRASLNGMHLLAARTHLLAGESVDLSGDTGAPPRWRWSGVFAWQRNPWNASLFVTHLSGFRSNRAGNTTAPQGSPDVTVVGVHFGHTLVQGLPGGLAKGARLGIGIGNLFDRDPPFSNTVFGYNGGLHSPLGRSYDLSLTVPF